MSPPHLHFAIAHTRNRTRCGHAVEEATSAAVTAFWAPPSILTSLLRRENVLLKTFGMNMCLKILIEAHLLLTDQVPFGPILRRFRQYFVGFSGVKVCFGVVCVD